MFLINYDLPIEYQLPSYDPIIITTDPAPPGRSSLTMDRVLPQLAPIPTIEAPCQTKNSSPSK